MSLDSDPERQRRFLGRGALTSFAIHSGLLFPLITVALILGAREAAQHENEVDVHFEQIDPSTLPEDLPPIDSTPTPKPKTKPEAVAMDQPVKPEEKPPEEPKEEPPPPPEPDKPPPPPPPDKQNKKSVDIDVDKESEPDPNAQFLAEKNNKVKEETRAERTNLEKATKGEEEASTPSERKDQTAGDKENKIAQNEDVKSKAGRSAPETTPRLNPSLAENQNQNKGSLLEMRNAPKREHEVTPETTYAELPRDPNGIMPMAPDHLESMKDMPGQSGKASQNRLRLTAKQYEYLFGDDREAAAALAKKQSSKKEGKFTRYASRIQSALENFIPEVKPGNQTALNTRAAPFAAFIARMHRSIHELWGFGYLVQLADKPYTHPQNDRNLMTKLEIVLAGDGTVDKVTVIKPSGRIEFDVAAIDTVYSAGPYAEPPPAIRSGNGKIYIHWSFHRDERQCATSGVDYFILDNAGDRGGAVASGGGSGAPSGNGAASNGAASGPSGSSLGTPTRPPRANAFGPRKRAASDGEPESDRPRALPEPDYEASRQAHARLPDADNPAARRVAESWFNDLVAGEVAGLVRDATFPFKTSGGESASSSAELQRMLRDLLSEGALVRPSARVELMTAAGMRGAMGVPAAFGDGAGMLFATAKVGADVFVLALHEQKGRWRPCGLVRL